MVEQPRKKQARGDPSGRRSVDVPLGRIIVVAAR
jgi:hypothetical protein